MASTTRDGGADIAALLKKEHLLVIGNSDRYSERSFIMNSNGRDLKNLPNRNAENKLYYYEIIGIH